MLKLNKYDTRFERNMMFILRETHFEILSHFDRYDYLFEMIDDKDDLHFEMMMTFILRGSRFVLGHFLNRNAPENSVRRGGCKGIVRLYK